MELRRQRQLEKLAKKRQGVRLRRFEKFFDKQMKLYAIDYLRGNANDAEHWVKINIEYDRIMQAYQDDLKKIHDMYWGDLLEQASKRKAVYLKNAKIWTFRDIEYTIDDVAGFELRSKFELSTDLWGDCKDDVYKLIRAGRQAGLNVQDIAESFNDILNTRGFSKVFGRWRHLKPASDEAIENEWLKSIGMSREQTAGDPYFFERDDFKQYKESYKSELPYFDRLPRGIDYRVARVIRTESMEYFQERMHEQSKSIGATGHVERKLAETRDAWKCRCLEAKEYINSRELTADEIPEWARAPLHPNCECWDEPQFFKNNEIIDRILKKFDKG